MDSCRLPRIRTQICGNLREPLPFKKQYDQIPGSFNIAGDPVVRSCKASLVRRVITEKAGMDLLAVNVKATPQKAPLLRLHRYSAI
jgi:hypothetical protein